MTDKFDEIAAAYQQSDDVRVKTKRELLAPMLAKRKAERDLRIRQFKCRFTTPFGHYYEMYKMPNDRYSRSRCIHCLKVESNDSDFGENAGGWFTFGVTVGVVLMAFLWWAS